MPEITSVETIRTKLREFDERVDGAITAAKTLARIKTDAERLVADIQEISAKSEQSLQKAEGVRLQLQQSQRDWETLKQQVGQAQADSKEIGNLRLSELDAAIQTLEKNVVEAEERLKATNKTSLAEQADLLRHLDASTQANADVAAKAQSVVAEIAGRLDGLLSTLRDDLQAEIQGKMTKAEELLESEAKRVEKYLEQEQETLRKTVESKAKNHDRLLREEMATFKEEVQRNLAQHQQGIDRQLTDFLSKQNAMVQNLSQQIDSFSRVSQAQSADFAATSTKLSDLSSAFSANKATATNELAVLTTGVNELQALLTEVQTGLHSQGELIATLDSTSQDTCTRLNQTLDKLKQLPLVGSKFK